MSDKKGFKGVSVERGVALESMNITSFAMCHYYFETIDDFLNAFMPCAEELRSDIVNYTNIEPVIQINQVDIRL